MYTFYSLKQVSALLCILIIIYYFYALLCMERLRWGKMLTKNDNRNLHVRLVVFFFFFSNGFPGDVPWKTPFSSFLAGKHPFSTRPLEKNGKIFPFFRFPGDVSNEFRVENGVFQFFFVFPGVRSNALTTGGQASYNDFCKKKRGKKKEKKISNKAK